MAFGMSYVRKGVSVGTVKVISARPEVITNGSNATFKVMVCTIDRGAGIGAIGSMHLTGLSGECSRLVPAEGATMKVRHAFPDQLLLIVTGHQPGVVQVRGLNVKYEHGWQRGTEHLGLWVKARTR
jgi:hypothetical protein